MFVAAHNLRVVIEIWLSTFGPVTHFGDSLTGLSGLRPLALLIKTPFFVLAKLFFLLRLWDAREDGIDFALNPLGQGWHRRYDTLYTSVLPVTASTTV